MRWLCTLLLALGLSPFAHPQTRTVRIGVLGVFHPQQLTLAADGTGELLVSAAGQRIFVRSRSACSLLFIRSLDGGLVLSCGDKKIRSNTLRASGRNQQSASLVIAVPGKIRRLYEGVLELKVTSGELVPVVTMDLETAVASVVRAETEPGTPIEALKAQAVVSRSYFVAGGGRHTDFDFCDLTHCQFLREPPATDSPAAKSAAATHGLILTYDRTAVAAMFTRSCSGRTRTPDEIGMSHGGYPYFSVECDFCYRDPVRWTRSISPEDAALLFVHGETGRLAIGRRLGWDAVPSNNFTTHRQGGKVILEGVGQGHGVGLCQRGARNMAKQGSDFRAILNHYFPNTRLEELPSAP